MLLNFLDQNLTFNIDTITEKIEEAFLDLKNDQLAKLKKEYKLNDLANKYLDLNIKPDFKSHLNFYGKEKTFNFSDLFWSFGIIKNPSSSVLNDLNNLKKYRDSLIDYKSRSLQFEEEKASLVEELQESEKEIIDKIENDKHVSIREAEEILLNYNSRKNESIKPYILLGLKEIMKITLSFYYESVINFEVDDDSGEAVIDFTLPLPEYVISGSKSSLKVKEQEYNKIICELTLSIIYAVFKFDVLNSIISITLNGRVSANDLSTGKKIEGGKCILSVEVSRVKFEDLELSKVDPIKCVESLTDRYRFIKEISSELPTYPPIKKIDKNDRRIITSDEVIDKFNTNTNLAQIDWQDFETLIRDILAKEFNSDTATVEVTQGSKDGGVDALIFDEDPLKGGKYIVQAKRYNILVGVSAVRDLYGTMQHERASKGILITTSNFGRDSIEFAKDKPITLINGSQLLHLLKKHNFNNYTIKLSKH